MTETERLMIKARASLLLSQPFFGTLALRLKMIEDPNIQTAGTDGRSLRYNPDFVKGLTHAQRVGLIAHETLHCAAGHPMRLGARDFEQFNEAGDYAINPMIIAAGMALPDGALIDPAYANLSAEEIYHRRYRKSPPKNDDDQQEQPGGGNFGGCGSFEAPKDQPNNPNQPSKSDLDRLAREWQIASLQAASIAKRAGNLPGSIKELIDQMKASRVDWREALKRFVTTQAKADYSWSPPNRRYIASGLYLPSLRSEKIGEIVFAIDTSASMDTEALQQALGELNAIVEDTQPEAVHVIECDVWVNHATTFTAADYPISVKTLHGRGGTRFSPVFDWVEENKIEPACLIYFSDMECADFGQEPSYPVLWAATQRSSALFGEIINVNAG